MAISLPSGFKVTAQEPIDTRLVLTKEEMLAKKKGEMPVDLYFAVCVDDHRVYIYDASLEKDAVTGRFRPLEDYLSFESEAAKAKFEQAIENSARIKDLVEKVGDAETAGSLVYNVNQLRVDVDNVTQRVDVLEPKVTSLETRVDNIDSELTNDLEPRVRAAEQDIIVLEQDIDEAQEDIEIINEWINNVKLDGGEIKAKYAVTKHVTNMTEVGSHPAEIEYKKDAELVFAAPEGYDFPVAVLVNGNAVMGEEMVCGFCKAKWVVGDTTATLSLLEVQGEIEYTITGVAK